MTEFWNFNGSKRPFFYAVPWNFCIFMVFTFLRFRPVKRCSRDIFRVFCENYPKNMFYAAQTQIPSITIA